MKIEIDWRATYQEFERIHGEPVPYQGRLLYPDGWTHAAKDYAGPEYPPPEDPAILVELKRRYWKTRMVRLVDEISGLERSLAYLRDLQSRMSTTLQQRVTVKDEDTGKTRVVRRPLDFAMIESKLRQLRDDLEHCERQLKEFK